MRRHLARPRRLRVGVALALGGMAVAPGPGVAAARPAMVAYQPPVDAPLVDRFRPPKTPYGAGNRGIDYATADGTEVKAAAPGVVTFAGAVGGPLHVVVLHEDGVRTSYSFLASIVVARGQVVTAGQVVGRTAGSLHFGARVGGTYIDPMLLLAGEGRGHARLVPDEGLTEHRRADRSLRPVTPIPATAVAWARRPGGEAAKRQ